MSPVNSWVDSYSFEEKPSTYVMKDHQVFFSDKLARKYQPIIYSGKCDSGVPDAVYYRIIKNVKKEYCIQYFYYWQEQLCQISHGYDYEPILIYLKPDNPEPYLIVNAGLAQLNCHFHKNEVRPRIGRRDISESHITVNLSPYPYYPFGKEGNVKYSACIKTYPLSGGNDLRFKYAHPLFGICWCSNVFSGAEYNLRGPIFRPPLKKLTDRVLTRWYFHHYNKDDDMPFGHDIAEPFSSPFIKFHKPDKAEVVKVRGRISR